MQTYRHWETLLVFAKHRVIDVVLEGSRGDIFDEEKA